MTIILDGDNEKNTITADDSNRIFQVAVSEKEIGFIEKTEIDLDGNADFYLGYSERIWD